MPVDGKNFKLAGGPPWQRHMSIQQEFKVELILSKRDLFDIQQKILKTELEHISLKVD